MLCFEGKMNNVDIDCLYSTVLLRNQLFASFSLNRKEMRQNRK
jgi:hypothetical protein